MLFALYSFAFLQVTGLILLVKAMISAPYATEDKNGFHPTSPAERESVMMPEPSLWNAVEMSFFHR